VTSRIVLLHSPLLGPSAWRAVVGELTRLGRTAHAPAWPRLSTIEAGYYAALTDSLAAALDASTAPAILVAHSGAGALVPALAARMTAPVAGVIFADAVLPHPGRSWFDTAPEALREQLRAGAQEGRLPRWNDWWPPGALARLVPDAAKLATITDELEPLPLAYFEETAPSVELVSPTAYLQFSRAYEEESGIADGYGWPAARLPLHHLAMLTHPDAVANALDSLAVKLAEPAHG
jgi:hypothetical protein